LSVLFLPEGVAFRGCPVVAHDQTIVFRIDPVKITMDRFLDQFRIVS
jgi:hypothetical protein